VEPPAPSPLRVEQAWTREVTLNRRDPFSARDWDVRADARQAAWEASSFADSFRQVVGKLVA
jgi:hypothetical protein